MKKNKYYEVYSKDNYSDYFGNYKSIGEIFTTREAAEKYVNFMRNREEDAGYISYEIVPVTVYHEAEIKIIESLLDDIKRLKEKVLVSLSEFECYNGLNDISYDLYFSELLKLVNEYFITFEKTFGCSRAEDYNKFLAVYSANSQISLPVTVYSSILDKNITVKINKSVVSSIREFVKNDYLTEDREKLLNKKIKQLKNFQSLLNKENNQEL